MKRLDSTNVELLINKANSRRHPDDLELSLETLLVEIGLSYAQYFEYCSGAIDVQDNDPAVQKMCNILNCQPDDILTYYLPPKLKESS